MTLYRAISFLLHFTIIPIAIGRLITYKQEKSERDSIVSTYIIGLFGSFAIFYVLMSVLEWHQYWNTITYVITGTFSALCVSYSVLVAGLIIRWIVKDKEALISLPKTIKVIPQQILEALKTNRYLPVYAVIFTLLLVVQMYFAYKYEINEWSYDDYDYVVNSQDTISSDTINFVNYVTGDIPFISDKRAVTGWPTYIAYLAKASGFEVTTICHSLLPVILLLVAYLVYYYIAEILFKDIENRLIFLILVSVGYMFGFYSHYSTTFRLLGALWQGKAVLSAIALPFFIFYLFQEYMRSDYKTRLKAIAFISLGIASLTTMSLILVTAATFIVWVCMCIYNRKIANLAVLACSLLGVVYQLIFYILMSMLIFDMKNLGPKQNYFKFRGRNNWWLKWFG